VVKQLSCGHYNAFERLHFVGSYVGLLGTWPDEKKYEFSIRALINI